MAAATPSAAMSAEEVSAMWTSVDDILAKKLVSRGLERGEYSRELDKAGLLKWHAAAAQEYQRMLDADPDPSHVYHLMELQREDVPLEALERVDRISLDPRVLESEQGDTYVIKSKEVLYGRLCAAPYKTGGVHTVLEDAGGRAVPVVIHHALAAADYPAGTLVAIKQPCYKTLTTADRCVGIMVDNPTYLLKLNNNNTVPDPESTFGCSEVVGPVEVALGRDEHNAGRRGLFTTREVPHGEVVLRTPPLTMGRKKQPGRGGSMLGVIVRGWGVDAATPFGDRVVSGTMQELLANLARTTQLHPRAGHMFAQLCVADAPTRAIPPVSLFDASVRGGRYDPAAVPTLDMGRARRTIATNVAGTGSGDASAVYALPSFMNHDCDPNCGVSYAGAEDEVQIVRVSGGLPAGGELTLGYWDVRRTWLFRQAQARDLHFTCGCRRCRFEERLAATSPRFKQLAKQWHDVNEAHLVKGPDGRYGRPPADGAKAAATCKVLRAEVENMLVRARMTPQQQEWIRKSFSQQVVVGGAARAYSSSSGSTRQQQRGGLAAPAQHHHLKVSVHPLSSAASLGGGAGAGGRVHVQHPNGGAMLSALVPRRMSLWRPVLMLF